MRRLLVIYLAALLDCSRARPSSDFLFPGELPTSINLPGGVHVPPVKFHIHLESQSRLRGMTLDEIQPPESDEHPEGHSRSETSALVFSPSSDEASDHSEEEQDDRFRPDTHGSSLDLVETSRPDHGDRSSAHKTQWHEETLLNVPNADRTVEPGLPRVVPSDRQTPSGSHPPTHSASLAAGVAVRTGAGRALTAGSVIFPDSFGVDTRAVQPLPSCDGRTVSATDPVTGRCRMLALAGDCPDGHLFLLSPEGTDAGCRPLPCPEDQLMVGDQCLSAEDPTACPPGRVLVRDERGRGRCDCGAGRVLWPADGRCYPALSQGPCPVGQYLTAPLDESRPRCADNPCVLDGSWLLLQPPAVGCFQLLSPADGCESQQMLTLRDGQLVCDPGSLTLRSIFDLPSVRCGENELMDYGGRCRDPLRHGFRQ